MNILKKRNDSGSFLLVIRQSYYNRSSRGRGYRKMSNCMCRLSVDLTELLSQEGSITCPVLLKNTFLEICWCPFLVPCCILSMNEASEASFPPQLGG